MGVIMNELKVRKSQNGATMIEVLVTVVIIAIGFLSILALQMQTMNNVTESNQRYVAAMLAQDMGERLRANAGSIADYSMSDWNTKTASCTNICSSDVDEWMAAIIDASHGGQVLPGGQGKITYTAGSNIVEIEIQWTEKDAIDHVDDGTNKSSYKLEVLINDSDGS